MKAFVLRTILAALCFAELAVSTALGGLILPTAAQAPNGYRLFFLTGGSTTAVSPNIGYYNSFVNAQAELNGSLVAGLDVGQWSAVVSTSLAPRGTGISAIQNTGISTTDSLPIFGLFRFHNG